MRTQHINFKSLCLIAGLMFAFWGANATPQDTIKGSSAEPIPEDTLREAFKTYIPQNHDVDLIKDRLACAEKQIPLTYNDVLMGFIKLYTIRRREYTQEILNRQTFYFPVFEQILRRHNMPEEIKYLSVVESALKPRIESPAAAVGLWQFIPSTGKAYGLYQDEYIDERMDIYKSTDAACRYLKDLYGMFGDWHLAMAAYNCGPGRVKYALRQTGGGDFWEVYRFLPAETRSYIPMYIAVAYALNYAEEHNIYVEKTQQYIPSDTILVNQFLSIESFGKAIEVPLDVMISLNPHLKKNFIPNYMRNYPIRFPADKKALVNAKRSEILEAAAKLPERLPIFTAGNDHWQSSTTGKLLRIHLVKNEEQLNNIASEYGVKASDIQLWNRLTTTTLQEGQELLIWQPLKTYAVK